MRDPEALTFEGYIDILERVVNLYNSGAIDDYSTSVAVNRYHIAIVTESSGGAVLHGVFGIEEHDVAGFYDMLGDIEYDCDSLEEEE